MRLIAVSLLWPGQGKSVGMFRRIPRATSIMVKKIMATARAVATSGPIIPRGLQ